MVHSDVITPTDHLYDSYCHGFNPRWSSSPKRIHLPHDGAEVLDAVRSAVEEQARVAVRSGGHCFENFVDNADVEVIIDMSRLDTIEWDAARNAIAVGAGTRLGALYTVLLERWGVTVPGGQCLSVAAGGHVAGAGYGPLCRRLGLVSDYLHAVEVVVLDDPGNPRIVVASNASDDPNRGLWWAHTGGGGGNFGIVTRYWFRGPDAQNTAGLPRPPRDLWTGLVSWPWAAIDEEAFHRLLGNFEEWHVAHASAADPAASLFARLLPMRRSYGAVLMDVQLDPAIQGAETMWTEFLDAVNARLGVPMVVNDRTEMPWLAAVTALDAYSGDPAQRTEHKSAIHRRPYTEHQRATLYRQLTNDSQVNPLSGFGISSFGGAVNRVAPDATACAHRGSIMTVLYMANWSDAAADDRHLRWLRETYRDLYYQTGGVPIPGAETDGCSINYPDVDLDDPEWNTSGLGSAELYYGANHARLQEIKRQWDPSEFFRHQQSIRPA
ncbi:FAD-binding protein [Nocardia sp. NBC_01499]|uniref:FAD-binding oxidoreductase n=1 Tax=Nocardia sp. NBC_01499 TaxID=2903597 RepID=UPI00386913B2